MSKASGERRASERAAERRPADRVVGGCGRSVHTRECKPPGRGCRHPFGGRGLLQMEYAWSPACSNVVAQLPPRSRRQTGPPPGALVATNQPASKTAEDDKERPWHTQDR